MFVDPVYINYSPLHPNSAKFNKTIVCRMSNIQSPRSRVADKRYSVLSCDNFILCDDFISQLDHTKSKIIKFKRYHTREKGQDETFFEQDLIFAAIRFLGSVYALLTTSNVLGNIQFCYLRRTFYSKWTAIL